MRVKVDFSTTSSSSYKDFHAKNPSIKISRDQWKSIIYSFSDSFKEHMLETGDKVKLPYGIGDFAINKRLVKKQLVDANGVTHIKLPIDWVKTREKGKVIYNFNYHTEGYFFGWKWFKDTARFKFSDIWYFKASRLTSRLLAHYIKIDNKYQHIYKIWN